jgi:hypothetical protein
MDYEKHFDEIVLNQELLMLNNMLEDCKSEDKINLINDVITYIRHKNIKVEVKENKVEKKKFMVDDYLLKRPWNKLSQIHKEKKLEEYIQNYLFKTTEENLVDIRQKIMSDFLKKKLNSKKVNYDPLSTIILSIEGLDYNNELCEYSYKS